MAFDIEKATAKELRAWKKTIDWSEVPDGTKEELDDLILEKSIEERLAEQETRQTGKAKAKIQEDTAYKRWPELKDKESTFYKRVMEAKEGDDSPGALLNAANEVGIQMFGKVTGRTPPTGIIASGHSADAPFDGSDSDGGDFLKRTSKLRKLFVDEGLMKDTPEAIARISKSQREEPYDGTTA